MGKTDSRKFTFQFKAKVINAYLTADLKVSLSQMERMTKINRQTITAWIKKKYQIPSVIVPDCPQKLINVWNFFHNNHTEFF